MLWLVDPLFQVLPEAAEEVRTTLLPWQNEVVPDAVMVGTAGAGETETVTGDEFPEIQPLASVLFTEKLPLLLTTMLWLVAPLDQIFPDENDDVSVTDPPLQNERGPEAEIEGVEGVFTITA